jgi:hypothetical protein
MQPEDLSFSSSRQALLTPRNIVISDLPTAAFLLDACRINPIVITNERMDNTTSATRSGSGAPKYRRH